MLRVKEWAKVGTLLNESIDWYSQSSQLRELSEDC